MSLPKRSSSQIPSADPSWHKEKSSMFYQESHYRLQAWIRQYVDEEIVPHASDWETQGFIPDKNFKRHADLGFLAASAYPLPKAYVQGVRLPLNIDLNEWDAFHDAILIDEIARCGYLGVVWGINGGATVGGPPLFLYANERQKQKYLVPLLRGEQRHCLCITEPEVGSDVAGMTTTATKSDDGMYYIVDGSKKWVTQGAWATHALVAVRTGKAGAKGISMFIIPLDDKDIERKRMINSGVNASGSTLMEFNSVKVPAENMIGKEGQGFEIIMSTFTHERLWVGITANRLGRVALEDSYQHALSRKTFGQPLFESQIIRAKFAKMAGLLEPIQAYIDELVFKSSRVSQQAFSPQAALLKFQAANNLETIVREAQQIFGGLGYSRGGRGGRVEQISRDVRVLVVSGGSEEILMDMVAKQQRKLAQL